MTNEKPSQADYDAWFAELSDDHKQMVQHAVRRAYDEGYDRGYDRGRPRDVLDMD